MYISILSCISTKLSEYFIRERSSQSSPSKSHQNHSKLYRHFFKFLIKFFAIFTRQVYSTSEYLKKEQTYNPPRQIPSPPSNPHKITIFLSHEFSFTPIHTHIQEASSLTLKIHIKRRQVREEGPRL